jgi:eukaryotic-like serine/threonine-protein kinase
VNAGSPSQLDQWIDFLTGQKLGDYRLEQCVGRGNFGAVFRASNESTGARVAIKVLTQNADSHAMIDFDNEGELLLLLNDCDGIINVIDSDVANFPVQTVNGMGLMVSVRYHVLSFASGSVDQLLLDPATRARLDWAERLRMWRGAVKGVHQMHLRGVAHRDLKSSNCLLMVHKNVSRVRLGDLGRAKNLSTAPTGPIERYWAGRGDMSFSPPEFLWLQGGLDSKDFIAADYYGLGSLLVELITGQGITALVLGDFRPIVQRALEDHQNGRYSDLWGLSLSYRSTIADIASQMPPSLRADAEAVLNTLCHPVASERLAHPPYSRDRLLKDGLGWVLRRADIMIKRAEIDIRQERQLLRSLERSAS